MGSPLDCQHCGSEFSGRDGHPSVGPQKATEASTVPDAVILLFTTSMLVPGYPKCNDLLLNEMYTTDIYQLNS